MGQIISIANQKGGVGKTTTSINLAAALAEAGQKVLAVDFDPQGNLSSGLGIEKNKAEYTVYEMIINDIEFENVCLPTYTENLFVLPSNINLSGAEIELLDKENREKVLKKYIDSIRDNYDYIIIDCPPSLSLLTINAFSASDSILIPVQCEYYALEGLGQMLKTISLVKKNLNKDLKVNGIVFTMYDARNNLSQQVVENVRTVIDEYIYDIIIPRNVRLAEAPSYGLPITEYDSKSAGAESYRMLAAEIISR